MENIMAAISPYLIRINDVIQRVAAPLTNLTDRYGLEPLSPYIPYIVLVLLCCMTSGAIYNIRHRRRAAPVSRVSGPTMNTGTAAARGRVIDMDSMITQPGHNSFGTMPPSGTATFAQPVFQPASPFAQPQAAPAASTFQPASPFAQPQAAPAAPTFQPASPFAQPQAAPAAPTFQSASPFAQPQAAPAAQHVFGTTESRESGHVPPVRQHRNPFEYPQTPPVIPTPPTNPFAPPASQAPQRPASQGSQRPAPHIPQHPAQGVYTAGESTPGGTPRSRVEINTANLSSQQRVPPDPFASVVTGVGMSMDQSLTQPAATSRGSYLFGTASMPNASSAESQSAKSAEDMLLEVDPAIHAEFHDMFFDIFNELNLNTGSFDRMKERICSDLLHGKPPSMLTSVTAGPKDVMAAKFAEAACEELMGPTAHTGNGQLNLHGQELYKIYHRALYKLSNSGILTDTQVQELLREALAKAASV